MSYLVYYPLMWILGRTRGFTPLHASALESERGGILIGGLGGVGKTTTCVALLRRPGVSLVAENLVLTDGEFVYPCYEPVRLDERSLAMLGAAPYGLTPMSFPEGLKDKWLFHVSENAVAQKVTPRALFLPQFSPARYRRALEPDLVAEKLVAMNRLTLELDDFGWFASALDMHWPQAGQALVMEHGQHHGELRGLARATPCFELGIDRTAGVDAVVEDILEAMS